MTAKRNFLAGLSSSGWTALAGLAAVPWFIRYLGIEAYGIVGLFLMLQALFVLLDMGLTPAVSREIARAQVAGTLRQARDLSHSMAIIFWAIAALSAVLFTVLAPWIAGSWLRLGGLEEAEVATAVALAGLAIGARWPSTLYGGMLIGAQRIDLASLVTIFAVTIANFGAVLVLAFVEPSLRAFFIWQAVAGLIQSLMMRRAAWSAMGGGRDRAFDLQAVKSVWRFSAGMAAVAATGVLFSQIDKIVLSRTVSLADFGKYALATMVAGILYRLILPAFNVVFPRFSGLHEAGDTAGLSRLYHGSTRATLTLLCPLAMFLAVAAEPLLSVWTREANIAKEVAPLVVLLIAGTVVHCAMYFPYALQIAHGLTSMPLKINLALSGLFLPMTIYLSLSIGALGAAISWLALHLIYLFLGSWVTHRQILRGESWRWISRSVLPPFAVTAPAVLAGVLILPGVASDWMKIAIAVALATLALLAGLAMLPDVRATARRLVGNVAGAN
ncbi:oligosaccharide flippase family protein [Sandaracinobacteroides hominis]|uniref:oligosaccharide flippase family protein n=1 Tax=Sandaracinobacteroides hominis TaxID=2780086 RepID=UPI0018F5CB11|nr:oligosaccharide flippase family protein [Sandaracinobacteroides hominis]